MRYLKRYSEREKRAINKVKQHLADDPFDSDGTIDVLVGANLVWEFITGSRIHTEAPGLFMIPSSLGLMLSGVSEVESGSDRRSTSTLLSVSHPSQHSLLRLKNQSKMQRPEVADRKRAKPTTVSSVTKPPNVAKNNLQSAYRSESFRSSANPPRRESRRTRPQKPLGERKQPHQSSYLHAFAGMYMSLCFCLWQTGFFLGSGGSHLKNRRCRHKRLWATNLSQSPPPSPPLNFTLANRLPRFLTCLRWPWFGAAPTTDPISLSHTSLHDFLQCYLNCGLI